MKTGEERPMNCSEKKSHASWYVVGAPLKSMPVTAQVFANYVAMPARRRPDGSTRPVALHGSALLVFADKSAEKVQLRTGYPARVSGHSLLDAREDRSDKIVRGH
jgi:hypothetical protein